MQNLINSLKNLIIEAGNIAVTRRNTGLIVSYKQDNSPVTNADIEISDFIYHGLKVLSPNIPVICEERDLDNLTENIYSNSPNQDNMLWLVDPIDGTKSYIKGEDSYTVNIALIQNGSPIIGLIYQPSIYKLYYTDQNNNLKIEQKGAKIDFESSSKNYYSAVVSSSSFNSSDIQDFLKKYFITELIRVSSSIKLCLIAEGKADIYPRFGTTMEWDIAAGHALIKANGGNIIDLNGKELIYNKKNFQNPHFYAYSKYWLEKKFGQLDSL